MTEFNTVHATIKLTIENEKNKILNYLDVTMP
jgi:hypothetical protein